MYIDPKEIELLTDFNQLNDFSKRVANCLDDILMKSLTVYGFSKDYIEENNSEFRIEVWPCEEVGFGSEEHSSAMQYDIYHLDEKLFTIDVIVQTVYADGEYRLEVQYETRKWKDMKGENEH